MAISEYVFADILQTGVRSVSWAMGAGDVGRRVNLSGLPDRTVHVIGATFGTLTLRGSNLTAPDETNDDDWFDMTDPQGNELTFAANGGSLIAPNPIWISPITTGGSDYTCAISATE